MKPLEFGLEAAAEVAQGCATLQHNRTGLVTAMGVGWLASDRSCRGSLSRLACDFTPHFAHE
jgi:hypothetical protein